MKRKAIAWASAILIIAAVSACFLRPVPYIDPNPDFGMVRDVYSFTHPETPVTDCEGDTDILNVEAVIWDEMLSNYPVANIRLTATKDIAFTRGIYENGTTIRDPRYYPESSIERLENGEWIEYGELWTEHVSLLMHGEQPYSGMNAGTDEREFNIPINDPGTYRFTYYFREATSWGYFQYSTGEELYHISFTLTIPEATEKPFDVISVQLKYYPKYVVAIDVLLRVNEETDVFLDRAAGSLEMLKEGKWVDVSQCLGILSEQDLAEGAHRYIGDLWRNGNVYFCQMSLDGVEEEYEHRLKLEFVENDDGSGERYTLTLRLRFDY